MQAYEAIRWALDLVNKKGEYLNGEFLKDFYVPGIRIGKSDISHLYIYIYIYI